MRKIALLTMLMGINSMAWAQEKRQNKEFISLLETYFGKTNSSGSKTNFATRSFYIQHNSLFICFSDPVDLFSKTEYRDTNEIPLSQLAKLNIVTGKSADGKSGLGLQFVPKYLDPKNPSEKKVTNGAVGTVKSQELNQVAAGTLNQKLTGQVAGVTVSNDNSPGGAAMVRIRGFGSVNANSPLYVVDDVPVSNINTINPNDIESISVLKDPSSTAIYGVRGANGVVVIKTKKGGISTFTIPDEIKYQRPLTYTLWVYGEMAKEFKNKKIGNQLNELINQWFN